jgi:general secretion pathway protein G
MRRGFTVIEMAVVMALVLVLAGLAIPRFVKIRQESHLKRAQSELQLISQAVLQLAWDTGKWPGGISRAVHGDAELWDLSTDKAGLTKVDAALFKNWQGPYIDGVPLDPWGSPYFFDPDYTIAGTMQAVVGSFGPNKVGRNLYDEDNVFVVLK